MPLKLIITRDFEHMSEVAARLLVDRVRERLASTDRCVLGLATGNTPTRMYKRFGAAANEGAFDAGRIVSFNLDEYIGLPGENAQQRTLHPESYSFFMVRELLGLLRKPFREANVPWGALVDAAKLAAELRANPGDWREAGTGAGRAVVIRPDAASDYLRWVSTAVLAAYEKKIAQCGGVDMQIIGVGEKGHVGFHEAGIPFEDSTMLLVRLDDNTIANAVKDGHFPSREASPGFAVTMGAELIFRARAVLLLASGPRKARIMARALLGETDNSAPVSYAWKYAAAGGELIAVMDREAASEISRRTDELARRGVAIQEAQ